MNPQLFFQRWQQETLPLIAILRGICPHEALAATDILLEAGFHWLEVPLNSPSALKSIHLMSKHAGNRAQIGGGTVLTPGEVDEVTESGGQLIISPDYNPEVIRLSREHGLISLPGVMTPTEAFSAIDAGASGLKLFPAEQLSPGVVKAYRAVLPTHIVCLPVGGISPDVEQMRRYVDAGANGFGLGGGLYQPGMKMSELSQRALAYRQAWLEVKTKR
ncbi:2-dehydro-3-deoxy-6-phosphogalactonate aldolase [Kluyvera intermedia]|uniref:2-dehydro-3-deoxy-6-phosphogalactonate aldolase n=1 Tax=Kluyvera intermedia TaxID=61648 RepID=UPI001F1AF565|nr:2-dehydro-3-deoxy-6-phosphogalactonate aldolase [Kluyvera intermedia]MCE9889144.1 2-dehydro-3-deoxy-6-phosphogalactonate aldolase [Kluyvera intermedia]